LQALPVWRAKAGIAWLGVATMAAVINAPPSASVLVILLSSMVGRSRYAEESPAAAPRIILHLHPLNPEGMILQYFVRINQHEDNNRRAL
jgi:hypothetical protein